MNTNFEVPERLRQLDEALVGESVRGRILVLASAADDYLTAILKRVCRPARNHDDDELFRAHAPLSSFSNRISVSYRLGLISKEAAEAFDMLRRVRNSGAHNIAFSLFETPDGQRLRRFVELTLGDLHNKMWTD